MKALDTTLTDADRTMSDARREYFLTVMGGEIKNAEAIHFLYVHFPESKLDRALLWLIANRLTGKSFFDFVQNECNGSSLELHRQLLARVEKSNLRPIIAGKDFR